MSDPALPAMDSVFNEVCILVTAAFALTLVPGFRRPERFFAVGARSRNGPVGLFGPRPRRRSHCFARRLAQRANRGGMRGRSGGGPLGRIGRQGEWLEMSVSDDGQGVASTEIEHLFFAERPRVHALVLLRRRLQGLFGRSFRLEVHSEIGEGTTVTMRIPLPKTFRVGAEPPRAISCELRELALN